MSNNNISNNGVSANDVSSGRSSGAMNGASNNISNRDINSNFELYSNGYKKGFKLNLFLRSLIFNVFIYLWMMAFSICFLPFLIFPLNVLFKLPSIWAGPILWCARFVVKIKFEVIGSQNMISNSNIKLNSSQNSDQRLNLDSVIYSSQNSTPVIYASNHQSTWEVFAFPFLIDNASGIIKKEMMYFPIIGLFFKKFMMIPVNRSGMKKGNWLNYAQKAFQKNRSIFIFPEGTRVAVNREVKYKSGVYKLYQKLNCPVVPVALNSGYFWPRRGFLKYPGTVQVKFLRAIEPGLDKNEFMSILENRIANGRRKIAPSMNDIES